MILQREILKEILSLFAVSLTTLLSMLMIGRLFKLKTLLIGQQASLADIGKLLVYFAPFLLDLILPVVCMLSVFLAFLRMGRDREITALGAGGISPWNLFLPLLIFCSVVSFSALANSMYGISWGMKKFNQTVLEIAKNKAQIALQPGIFNRDFPDTTIFVRSVDSQDKSVRNLFLQTEQEGLITVVAPSGQIYTDKEKGELYFLLKNGTLYQQKGNDSLVSGFDEYRVRIKIAHWLGETESWDDGIECLSFTQLLQIARGEKENTVVNDPILILLAVHKRLARPFSCLILGCVSLPLALLFQGLRRQNGIVVSLGGFLLYSLLFSLGETLGQTGSLTPLVGIWFPTVIFSLLFFLGMWRVTYGRYPRLQKMRAEK